MIVLAIVLAMADSMSAEGLIWDIREDRSEDRSNLLGDTYPAHSPPLCLDWQFRAYEVCVTQRPVVTRGQRWNSGHRQRALNLLAERPQLGRLFSRMPLFKR